MRSAETTQICSYTRQELAEMLGISECTLRRLARDLRSVLSFEEFDFQPNDGKISVKAAQKIIEFRVRAKETTNQRVLEEIKVKGL